jgi:hypothetical protein
VQCALPVDIRQLVHRNVNPALRDIFSLILDKLHVDVAWQDFFLLVRPLPSVLFATLTRIRAPVLGSV